MEIQAALGTGRRAKVLPVLGVSPYHCAPGGSSDLGTSFPAPQHGKSCAELADAAAAVC